MVVPRPLSAIAMNDINCEKTGPYSMKLVRDALPKLFKWFSGPFQYCVTGAKAALKVKIVKLPETTRP